MILVDNVFDQLIIRTKYSDKNPKLNSLMYFEQAYFDDEAGCTFIDFVLPGGEVCAGNGFELPEFEDGNWVTFNTYMNYAKFVGKGIDIKDNDNFSDKMVSLFEYGNIMLVADFNVEKNNTYLLRKEDYNITYNDNTILDVLSLDKTNSGESLNDTAQKLIDKKKIDLLKNYSSKEFLYNKITTLAEDLFCLDDFQKDAFLENSKYVNNDIVEHVK